MAEAEPLYRRALAIDERSYGPDHPDVARALNNLAELLQATNRLAEAEPLYRRALAIDERSYGPDHPTVALNNLAELLQATNRLAEAEPLYRRALAIDERSYGPDHPTVALRLNNLASLLRATNRLDEAEPLSRRAVQILIQFGAEPGTSTRTCAPSRQITRLYEGFWKGRSHNGNPIRYNRSRPETRDWLLSIDKKLAGTRLARAGVD